MNLRPHLALWAEAGVPLAGRLMGGADDARANCVDILDRAIAALPAGADQVPCRWDAGYFAAELAKACIARGVQFAIGARRTSPLVAAAQRIPEHLWVPAVGMDDSEVAVVDYLPGPWPKDAGIGCIARRTRIPVERIPTARARKRRTIPTEQLTLALEGRLDAVFGHSFIVTNFDLGDPEHGPEGHTEKLAEVEWWYRHRTDIEALNKDAKHGAALCGYRPESSCWPPCSPDSGKCRTPADTARHALSLPQESRGTVGTSAQRRDSRRHHLR